MSQQLWLLRHGDAEPHGARPDFERRLTQRGEEQARAAGAALARLGISFDLALTSPRVRARDTAALAGELLGLISLEHEPLAGDFDRAAALDAIAGQDTDSRVLLTGHEPDLSQLVHDFTGARVAFKKGGLAVIALKPGSGTLLALLRPAEVAALGGL